MKNEECKFVHELDPDFKRPPCHAFNIYGRCGRGAACPYSHEKQPATTETETSDTANGQGEEDKAAHIEDLLMRWRFKIPRNEREKKRNPTVDLAEFFSRALELVEAGSQTMQEVINHLNSEYGLYRLDQLLTNETIAKVPDNALQQLWRGQILPLLKILGHEKLLVSRVAETTHNKLLIDIYGSNGQKAVRVFNAALRCMQVESSDHDDNLAAVLAVLAGVYILNGSAHVNPHFQPIVEGFIAMAATSALSGVTSCHLQKIRIRHGFGEELPGAGDARIKFKAPLTMRPQFVVKQDLPGELSDDGPRHDNDKADIRDISILPTMEEIQSSRSEYLPRADPDEWHLQVIAGLIDRHFRCLREDTVGQLRDVAKFEFEQVQNPLAIRTDRHQGGRFHTYRGVQLAHVTLDNENGFQFVFSFDQPAEVRKLSGTKRKQWWQHQLQPPAFATLHRVQRPQCFPSWARSRKRCCPFALTGSLAAKCAILAWPTNCHNPAVNDVPVLKDLGEGLHQYSC